MPPVFLIMVVIISIVIVMQFALIVRSYKRPQDGHLMVVRKFNNMVSVVDTGGTVVLPVVHKHYNIFNGPVTVKFNRVVKDKLRAIIEEGVIEITVLMDSEKAVDVVDRFGPMNKEDTEQALTPIINESLLQLESIGSVSELYQFINSKIERLGYSVAAV